MTKEMIKAAIKPYSEQSHIEPYDLEWILIRLLCPESEKPEPTPCPKCGKPLTIAGNGWSYCKDCDRMGTNTYRASGQPAAPPPSPSPDATEKGGDRAREFAGKHITAAPNSVTDDPQIELWSKYGGTEIALQVNGMFYGDAVDIMRDWLARVIRAYGDELLERAAVKTIETVCSDKDCECDDCEAHRHDAQVIRAMKSSAAKGAANG